MISAGIDIGASTVKAVILKDGKEILAQQSEPTGFDQKAAADAALAGALKKAGLEKKDLNHIIGTGAGRDWVPDATGEASEIKAAATGAYFLFPSARTIISVGSEEARGARCDDNGNIKDFVMNDRCAAGAGTFVGAMARALETSVEDFVKLYFKSTKAVPMNAQCTIFAESEVVSLIHANESREDISKAIHEAIADRIASMIRRIGVEKDVVLVGGLARNAAFVDSLKNTLGVDVLLPEQPEYVDALGAALVDGAE